jgi:hypothetical protein
MKFVKNEGAIDRVMRIVAGLVLIALVFVGPQTAWGWLGLSASRPARPRRRKAELRRPALLLRRLATATAREIARIHHGRMSRLVLFDINE